MIALIVAGAAAAYTFRAHPPPIQRGAAIGEHWHATYTIYICGRRMTNYPTVEGELHSHGDGFIHDHPATQAFAGPNANLGNFLRLYETSIGRLPNGKNSIQFPDGTHYTDGDTCPNDHKHYDLEALVNGKRYNGDPSKITPHDKDKVEIKFGPEGKGILKNPYSLVKHLPDAGIGGQQEPGDVAPTSGQNQQLPVVTPAPAATAKPAASP